MQRYRIRTWLCHSSLVFNEKLLCTKAVFSWRDSVEPRKLQMYFANSQKFSKLFDHPNENVIRCGITQRVQDAKFHVTVLLVSKSNLSSIIPFVLSKKSPHYTLLKFEEKNVMIHFSAKCCVIVCLICWIYLEEKHKIWKVIFE